MSFESGLDILLACLNFIVAGYLVIRVRSLAGHLMAAPIALGAFFTLRGFARLIEPFGVSPIANERTELAIEVLLAIALTGIIVTLEPIVRGIAARDDAARFSEAEYERARRHYTQVVRHRMVNPIQVIKGGAQTLQVDHAVDPITQARILEAIIEAATELEQVSLVPDRRDDLEHELDAVPRIGEGGDERRRTPYPDGTAGPR